jgi:uncharacterized membrane protein
LYPKTSALVILFLVLLSFFISVIYYPQLPDPMATHWDGNDRVDGYMGRFWGAFFVPLMLVVLWAVFAVVPRIAPGKPAAGRGALRVGAFIVALFIFFIALHFQMIQWNLGNEISFSVTVPIGFGVIFIYFGMMLGAVEPNWVVGIRTYWTLKSRVVWEHTHQRASLLFRILGVIYIISVFFRGYILLFMLLPAVFIAIYLPAYSFFLYQKIEKIEKRL